MDLNQFTQALRSIEGKDPKELPEVVDSLKNTIQSFSSNGDLQNLGCGILKMCEFIMNSKEVKDDVVGHFEELIDCAIITSIKNNFQVGFDALRLIFNATSEFYKTARIDSSLKYPIGIDRPLVQYYPKIGEQCDVVRPYITSTSFCGWTRATVLEIDNNKYTLQYINTSSPFVVRGEPWFAPLGQRTQDFEWRKNLQLGSPVQALLNRVWYKSTIVQLGQENGSKRVRVSYRRFAENGDREDALGCRYFGLGPNEDEWLDLYSPRIQRCGKMANKNLCYYTFNSDEILPDDNYDILFEREYAEKPFHAITRSLMCKSLSILRFINTWTQNQGFERVIDIINDPNTSIEIAFAMIANAGCLTGFIPRMDMYRHLPSLHDATYKYFREQVKNLTPQRIDMGYYCIDMTGRRLHSLSEVYKNQNDLRKVFINEFLDLNLEKKMLALRYINDLINPKKPYSLQEREEVDRFLKNNHIFDRIFQANTHQQILTRTQLLLRYFIEKGIVSESEFAQIWHIVPLTDQRAHAAIEKLIVEVSKFIPISFVELILEKLLNLKETELTAENLNLLRELKNREISQDYQMRILSYLWEVITVKSINIKTSIQEEVEKVFKVFVGGIKNPNIRVNVMDSMVKRLAEAKKIKNEIDLLRDFIMTYPEKPEMVEETDAPVSIYDAVNHLKTKNIYQTLLQILQHTKKEILISEILNFMGFLFQHDFDDINEVLRLTYQRLGPSDRFFEWVHKIMKRVRSFIDELFSSTKDFSAFENLSMTGFEALRDMIFEINEEEKKIKVMKTYEYKTNQSDKPETKEQGTSTPGPIQVPQEKKQEKSIGPSLPQTKKHVFVLVSPFSLIGMRFLNHLLLVLKNSRVYDETVKLIIQFIVNLDYSITDKTQQYRREFLSETIKEIDSIISKNQVNDKIKQELQVYINLFVEIFSETEKNGLGDLAPHFQNIEGEKLSFKVENTFPRAKGTALQRFDIVVNENCTIWKFKTQIGDVIKESPSNIDVIKFVNPIDDAFNGKSLSDMFFYDGESIKIAQKAPRMIPKHSLVNSTGDDLSQKFLNIVKKWFNQFCQDRKLSLEGMKKLSDTYWRGSLFRQEDRIKKVYEEHDKDKKGYLTFEEFKEFFYIKIAKNEHAIWKIINLAGYKNNLESVKDPNPEASLDVDTLPRRILSSSEVYGLIFGIFKNPTFKDVHLNFFRLLSLLEVSSEVKQDIENNIYAIITDSECMHELCYKLEVANSVLSVKQEFYFEFWRKGGVEKIIERINKVLESGESIYKMDLQLRNTVLPNLVRILNMYAKPLLGSNGKGRIIANFRLNYFDLQDMLKKYKDFKELPSTIEEINKCQEHLREVRPDFKLSQIAPTSFGLLHNLMKNYTTESSDFIPKLTAEIVRLIGYLSVCEEFTFDPLQLIYGVKNDSLNYRRGCCNIIYFYIQDREEKTEEVLMALLAEMPNENKHVFSNYFSLLARIIQSELLRLKQDTSKDSFFVGLANDLLKKLFTQVTGEPRNALIGDKVIMGILMALQILVNNPIVCKQLCLRKHEITEKCLFAYDVEKKIESVEVTAEMLAEQKQQMHFKDYVICKTDDTRSIAYNIVAKLHEASKDEDKDFLEKYVLPVFKDLAGEIRITTSKSLQVGLKNFGSTCYMNSMLQVLNSVGPFRNILMKTDVQAPLVKELKELFASLFYSERMDYAPKQLLQAFVPPINPGIQQDTTEFLNFLFDQVESGLSESEFSRLLDEIFRGTNTAQMICHSCGYKKENKETFFSFGVQIDGKYNLGAALEGSYQGQVISDYLCDNCGNKGETTKRNILSEVPSVLFIHLRRIVFNYDMFINMKIHTRLQFPDELNIEPYTKEGVELREQMGLQYMKGLTHNEEETKKFEQQALHGKEKDFYKLKLKGVIVHSGSADVGHYYSILPDGKSWCKFDDSRVSIFPQSGFEKECYGGTWTTEEWGGFGSSTNAYVLVYEKVIKNPITLHKGDDQVVIAYDDVKPHNSVEQYKAVWLDNHRFMVELHILDDNYSKNFLKFACSIMQNSPHSNRVALLSEILYTVTYHSEMAGDLPKLFADSIAEAGPEILHNFILKDKKKTFKLLFSRARSVREFMAFYMQVVLCESYRKGDEAVRKQVIDLIHEYLGNMTGEVAKNWLRIDGYFRFLELMVTSSVHFPELWQLFCDYHLISVLIDFVMEKTSPVRIGPKNYSLGTKTNPMDFSNALNTIIFLLRHSYGFLGENFEVPTIPEPFLFHLNDNDVICLSHMDFYRKMFKERQNLTATAAIVQRLCIRNLEFSKAISEPLLTAIGCITDKNDEMEDLSHVVREVLVIKDEFWKQRADMLLGWGTPYLLPDNTISAMDTERFVFTSTLFDIFPVQCLLNYAYLYRANMSCFQLLKAIVQGCSVSEQAMNFLASQPSLSYAFSSYIDWIKLYVGNFLDFQVIEEKKKERLQKEVEYLTKYIDDLLVFRKEHIEECMYKPLLTGKLGEKRQVHNIKKGDVEIVIVQIDTNCLESQPTGSGNASIDKYMDGSLIDKKVSEDSTLLRMIRKPNKGIALKMKPVEEAEDKELVSLFDDYPDPSTVKANTGTSPEDEKENKEEMKDQAKEENQAVIVADQPIILGGGTDETIDRKEEGESEKVEEKIDIEGIFTTPYFREIEIYNRSRKTKVVKLAFRKENNTNMLLPCEVSYKVSMKSNETIALAKQDVDKAWGDISIDVIEEDFDKEKHDRKAGESTAWFKLYGARSEIKAEAMEEKKGETDEMKNNTEKQENAEKAEETPKQANEAESLGINCPMCTFLNPREYVQCEVCFSNLH